MEKFIRLISLHVILIYSCLGSTSEQQLIHDLFKLTSYNPLIRPVENMSMPIVVTMGVTLFQVITVEERNQVMKTNNWIRLKWHDYQLKWDSQKYGGIDSIRLPCEEVWKPDIVLLNNADGNYEQSYSSNTVHYSDGTVMWIPPSIYKSSCTIDVRYFPFDQQECSMMFGSWTYSASQVQLVLYENKTHCDLSNYVVSGTWDLIDCPATISNVKKYSELKYDIVLRRKTLFYTVNLLTPCVLTSFLSVLTFYLPADAQEKVTLSISILLALVVFLLLVSKSLPPTSVTMPLISKYLFFTFIMNIITTVVSVVIININFRSPRTYKMPRWMRIVFLSWLPAIIFMTRPDHKKKYEKWKERKIERQLSKSAQITFTGMQLEDIELKEVKINDLRNNQSSSQGDSLMSSPKVIKALEAVEFIADHLKTKDDYDEICNDWKYVAAVIDRFLLYCFLVTTVSGTISIIVDAPHIFQVVDQAAILKSIAGS